MMYVQSLFLSVLFHISKVIVSFYADLGGDTIIKDSIIHDNELK